MKLTLKMERWIETRLWNLKVENKPIHLSQTASELANFFGLGLSTGGQKRLERAIGKIRFRVYKRHERRRSRRRELARTLGLPEKLIERWFRAGWIDPGRPESASAAIGMIFERDYYCRFIEPKGNGDRIPEDPEISITSS